MAKERLSLDLVLIEKVLKVSISKDPMRSSLSGFSYDSVALPSISRELQTFPHPTLMQDPTFIDSILMERLNIPQTSLLSYSSECYALARSESQKNINLNNPRAQKLLQYLQEILVNYSALGIYQAELFINQIPYSELSGAKLGAFRIVDYLEHGGSKDFLSLLIEYWSREDNGFKEEVLLHVNVQLNQKMKLQTLLDDPSLPAGVFKDLLDIKAVTGKLLDNYFYNESWNGAEIETNSVFGAYLSPGLFPRSKYFGKVPGMPGPPDPIIDKLGAEIKQIKYKKDFSRAIEKYSNSSKAFTTILTNIFKVFLKDDRKRAMDWLCDTVTKSASKAKLGNRLGSGNANTSPSDNFCMNLFDILLQICSPFLNPEDERVLKISEFYMAANVRMQKVQDTPLCGSIEKLTMGNIEVGTVTEFYYCCCLMFHYSWHTAHGFMSDLNRVLQRFNGRTTPAEKNDFEYYLQVRSCFDVILWNPHRNALILKLTHLTLNLVIKWTGFTGTLPLPPPVPVLSIIPEFFIEDISEFYVCMMEMQTDLLNSLSNQQIVDLLTAITVILNSPTHFHNPYIRAKYVKSFGLLLTSSKIVGEITGAMNIHRLFQEYFIEGLVRFYSDIEFGGGHSQFYDKFEYRHYASKIFEHLWKYPLYQRNTIILQDQDFFKKFINYILNDMNFCLQEGLDYLAKIKVFQSKNPGELNAEEQEEFKKIQGTCKYFMQQSNEYISMLKQLTDWNSELFITDEFGERTAALLNNFLKHLCGPKCLELKVTNPQEFHFKPEELLGNLITIYLHISRHDHFFECLLKDERSFSLDVFNKAMNVCMKRPILSYDEKGEFRSFINKAKEFDGNKWQSDDREIPDEFLCAITYDIMKNPVRLPSGTIVDRVNIVRHLLSDEHDPFNRQPLTVQDLVEENDLKIRIEEWKQQGNKS